MDLNRKTTAVLKVQHITYPRPTSKESLQKQINWSYTINQSGANLAIYPDQYDSLRATRTSCEHKNKCEL